MQTWKSFFSDTKLCSVRRRVVWQLKNLALKEGNSLWWEEKQWRSLWWTRLKKWNEMISDAEEIWFVSSGYAEHASHVLKWNQSPHRRKHQRYYLQQQSAISPSSVILFPCMTWLNRIKAHFVSALLHRRVINVWGTQWKLLGRV